MPSFLTKVITALTEKTTSNDNDYFVFGNEGGNEIKKISYENLKNEIMLQAHPIGSIYESTESTNPSQLFGGTWETFGSGQVLVCVDFSQKEFNSVNKTGGSKTQTLTKEQLPNITGQIGAGSGTGNVSDRGWGAFRSGSGVFSASVPHQYSQAKSQYAESYPGGKPGYGTITLNFGSDEAHNNLQPYITIYRWKRTA